MGFSLWNLFKSGLLCINALLILNRQRFLSKYNLDQHHQDQSTAKGQLAGLLQAVQYLKVPVILLNGVTIIFELLLGGS